MCIVLSQGHLEAVIIYTIKDHTIINFQRLQLYRQVMSRYRMLSPGLSDPLHQNEILNKLFHPLAKIFYCIPSNLSS